MNRAADLPPEGAPPEDFPSESFPPGGRRSFSILGELLLTDGTLVKIGHGAHADDLSASAFDSKEAKGETPSACARTTRRCTKIPMPAGRSCA